VHDPAVFDPADPHHDPFWVMIGGLFDPGEDFADAAVPEAFEETRLPVIDQPRWVWQRQWRMSWRGKDVLHKERFFLARTDRTEIDTSGLDERERSWTIGHRWWRAEEIAGSPDRFDPAELFSQSVRPWIRITGLQTSRQLPNSRADDRKHDDDRGRPWLPSREGGAGAQLQLHRSRLGGLAFSGTSSSNRMRSAAPSRSSYCPLRSDHRKAERPAAPRASATGMR
jgi:ADP-ribose pyrophosphatase YjhB (NUDIX family)